MAHPIRTAPVSFLRRVQRDPNVSDAARRRAARELATRERQSGRCPDDARCVRWDCDLEHGGGR